MFVLITKGQSGGVDQAGTSTSFGTGEQMNIKYHFTFAKVACNVHTWFN